MKKTMLIAFGLLLLGADRCEGLNDWVVGIRELLVSKQLAFYAIKWNGNTKFSSGTFEELASEANGEGAMFNCLAITSRVPFFSSESMSHTSMFSVISLVAVGKFGIIIPIFDPNVSENEDISFECVGTAVERIFGCSYEITTSQNDIAARISELLNTENH
ncbi:MAG: hypothetical protein LBB21_01625 [Holosporaceae bacterium]|jgi:hypothetical protein|nr:hypothetical protein [Holosporaceae bacterium]